jgi:hypothetical protein
MRKRAWASHPANRTACLSPHLCLSIDILNGKSTPKFGAPAFSFFPSGQNQCSAVQISAIADKERMSVDDKPQDDFFRVQVGRSRGQDDQS